MVHCWVENGPLSGWEALTLAANPSAMLDQFDWKLFQVWLKLKSSLTETQVKFDWNLKCVWLKVKLSFSQTGGGLGLDWRTVSMGLIFSLSLTTRVSHWESKWLSLRTVLNVIDIWFECHWLSSAVRVGCAPFLSVMRVNVHPSWNKKPPHWFAAAGWC